MRTPYRNRLPMAYLPAGRAVDTVGMHPMFYGRVSGVGSIEPGGHNPYNPLAWRGKDAKIEFGTVACLGPNCQMDGGLSKAQVCHPQSPAGTCKPVDWTPPAAVPDAPAKPTGSALPLVIGAALLLLS